MLNICIISLWILRIETIRTFQPNKGNLFPFNSHNETSLSHTLHRLVLGKIVSVRVTRIQEVWLLVMMVVAVSVEKGYKEAGYNITSGKTKRP